MANKKTTRNSAKKQAVKTAKKVAKKSPALAVFLAFLIIALAIGGYYIYKKYFQKEVVPITGEMTVHFPELGSYYTGDCTLIKVGDVEVLIDAGSKTACIDTLDNYISTYCTDNV